MTNVFLKVNKDLFNLGLAPIDILIMAQIMEYHTNTGKCFISDAALAEAFGVSTKTVSRTIANLEHRGFIKRETKNTKGGRERVMYPVLEAIEKELAKDKMTFDKANGQNVLSPIDKMSIGKGQNDFIKDNIKDKEKENNSGVILPTAEITPLQESQKEEEVEIDGIKAQVMTKAQAIERYGLSACANRVKTAFSSCYWISRDLIKLIDS